MFLAHITEPVAEFDINFSEGSGTMWQSTITTSSTAAPVIRATSGQATFVEAVAEILQRHSVIEVSTWRGRQVKTRIFWHAGGYE